MMNTRLYERTHAHIRAAAAHAHTHATTPHHTPTHARYFNAPASRHPRTLPQRSPNHTFPNIRYHNARSHGNATTMRPHTHKGYHTALKHASDIPHTPPHHIHKQTHTQTHTGARNHSLLSSTPFEKMPICLIKQITATAAIREGVLRHQRRTQKRLHGHA